MRAPATSLGPSPVVVWLAVFAFKILTALGGPRSNILACPDAANRQVCDRRGEVLPLRQGVSSLPRDAKEVGNLSHRHHFLGHRQTFRRTTLYDSSRASP